MAQTELGQLQEKRERIVAQLDEIDREIVALKKKRHAELMAEIAELGLNVPATTKASSEKLSRQRDLSKPCKVCGETGHDARRHRSDGKKTVAAST